MINRRGEENVGEARRRFPSLSIINYKLSIPTSVNVLLALLAHPHPLAALVHPVADPGGLVALRADEHDVGTVDVAGALDDPALAHLPTRAHGALDDVDALHQQPPLARQRPDDLPALLVSLVGGIL